LGVSFGDDRLIITINLTMDDAHAVADAISESAERDERDEPILRPDRLQALRAVSNKLTAAIGKDRQGGVGGEERWIR
jgi:hypothetical protein